MRSTLSVKTIGTVAIDVGDRRIGPSSGLPFALLLYVASQQGRSSPRRVVQDLLFSTSQGGRAAHSLRQLLYRLRQLGVPLRADDDEITLLADDVSIDWLELVDRTDIGVSELEPLSLGLFPGYSPGLSDGFRDWFDAERTDIALRLSHTLTIQLGALRRTGRWDLVDATANALLALDPLSEEGTLAKAEALAASGSKSAALGVIDGYMQELGEQQPQLRLAPATLKRRISERVPDDSQRSVDEQLFVGREDVMELLSSLGSATRAGQQEVLLLWGEAGIGKSRLVAEYRALAALQVGLTIQVGCQPHDVFRPLGIVCDLVMQLLGARGALGCDPGARSLLQRLVTANKHVDGAREALVTDIKMQALVRSLNDLISAVASESALQIFIDDAQWLDETSHIAILGAFAGRTDRRSSLVLTSRERTLLAETSNAMGIVRSARLHPLPEAAALSLALHLLTGAHAANADSIAPLIVDQARGNPFVIRTLCADFAATNDSQSLKQTLTEILARRLERLSPDAMRALESAVILGKYCTLERLARLLETSRQRLLTAIEELDDQGLIEVTDGSVVSCHALLAAAVVTRMASSVRRLLHAAAAEQLQTESERTRAWQMLWDCAEHWRVAGNDDQAISVLIECSQRALASGRPPDAVQTLQRALNLSMSDQRRFSIVKSALEMAFENQVYKNLEYLFSELARLRVVFGEPAHQHDHLEVHEMAVTKHFDTQFVPSDFLTRFLECAAATTASVEHRLSAARTVVVLAELMLDRAIADDAFTKTQGLEGNRRFRLGLDVIYHGMFGNAATARRLTGDLAECGKQSLPQSFGSLVNACIVQSRVGDPAVSEAAVLEGMRLCREHHFEQGGTILRLVLTRLYWSTERVDEAARMHAGLRKDIIELEDPENVIDYCVIGARIALLRKDFAKAAALTAQARSFPHPKQALFDLQLQACELDLRLATGGDAVTDDEIDDLLRLHLRGRGFGLHDEIMLTVVRCMESRNQSALGQRLLEEYLSEHRRDGFPVPSWLLAAKRGEDHTPVRAPFSMPDVAESSPGR